TFWGDAIDYGERWVREWALQNAEMWIRDYHVDGLRLDAVHAIFDDSPTHICKELKQRVGGALVISEAEVGDWRPIDEWGHDAQWADRSHHDQVGNRALGDRLPPPALEVAAAVTLFSACTPLLFMGEECLTERPFQFFTDHIDPAIAAATREGRRKEFEAFASFRGDVPDPQAVETFLRSKLGDCGPVPLYRELLELHRTLPSELEVLEADDETKRLRLRRGATELVADFRSQQVEILR